MQMNDFELFIKQNRIKKIDIAKYLGVSNGFITQLTNGVRGIPEDKLQKILANPDWDTSMFASDGEMLKNTSSQKEEEVAAAENAATMITIPQRVWAVIENQAASLKAKDEQMNRLITQIEQSNARYDRLFASISGVSTGFPATPTDLGVKNPPPIKSELK
jgi:transcriptional regulator with XRE-family HTH domain|nr:MAG TPA: protein-turn-helix DNA binding protein [Caudoviricetes sp.]